ncbi:hypothetical protein lerEdw1_010605 [Lerista edwardsae]|nr:hypothetical protein lerEdw1_010605 [Lerista edwardsae]
MAAATDVISVAVAVSSSAAPDEAAATAVAPGVTRSARLPLTRVKALVKADPDVSLASQEAIFVLARAAAMGSEVINKLIKLSDFFSFPSTHNLQELFVETIAKDAYVYAQQGKRKTLQRKDLDNAIEAMDEFAFLEGTLD